MGNLSYGICQRKTWIYKKVRNKIVMIYALTIIDKATSWPEIVRVMDKTSYETL